MFLKKQREAQGEMKKIIRRIRRNRAAQSQGGQLSIKGSLQNSIFKDVYTSATKSRKEETLQTVFFIKKKNLLPFWVYSPHAGLGVTMYTP